MYYRVTKVGILTLIPGNFNTLFVILLPRQQDSFPTLYRRFDDTIPLNKDYVVPLRIVHTFLVNKVRANELMKIEGQ